MKRVIPPFLVSFLTLGLISTSAKPMNDRFVCDAKDELLATIYNDPMFSKPENHKKRDRLILRILQNQSVCEPRD